MDISQRLQKVQAHIEQKSVDGFLVTHSKNIYYLSGFIGSAPEERESALLVTRDTVYLFVPQMYESLARELKSIRSGFVELVVDRERDGLLYLFNRFFDLGSRLLFESSDLRVAELERIQQKTGCEMEASDSLVEDMRVIKDAYEIACLRRAASITDEVFNTVVAMLSDNDYTRLSEVDLADEMHRFARDAAGDGFGFDPIVASGQGSSEPHYVARHKKLERGQPLLIDFGVTYQQYNADLTRTIYLGEASEKFKKVYGAVAGANRRALDLCSPNVTMKELFGSANAVFVDAGLDMCFIHGLGHGVGLDIHEEPRIRSSSTDALLSGMVITIEPGLYFDREFGIRIEDLVMITDEGCEVLSNSSSKKLIEI